MKTGILIGALVVAASLSACAEERADRSCPTGGTALTWQNFGQPFFADHCQTCHSPDASVRMGSHHGGQQDIPAGYDFGAIENVRDKADRIYLRAAGANDSMPPGPDDPPEGEREKLAEWLACGAP